MPATSSLAITFQRLRCMRHDRFDLPLTTVSDVAASAYADGLDRLLSIWTGADAAMDRAIAADPDFALAHIGRARVHQIFGRPAEARASAARARSLAANATERERGHIHIIASVIEGQPASALADAERHLDEYPRDALVLALLLGAFGLYAFSGRPDHDQARLAICERHAAQYGQDWWFLSHLGWANTSRQRRPRPRPDRARVGAAQRERQRSTRAGACLVRAGRRGNWPAFPVRLAARAQPRELSQRPPVLASRLARNRIGQFRERTANLPGSHSTGRFKCRPDQHADGRRVAAVAPCAQWPQGIAVAVG